jgi:hypothetical protein
MDLISLICVERHGITTASVFPSPVCITAIRPSAIAIAPRIRPSNGRIPSTSQLIISPLQIWMNISNFAARNHYVRSGDDREG